MDALDGASPHRMFDIRQELLPVLAHLHGSFCECEGVEFK